MTKVACIGEAMIELSMSEPPEVGVAGDTLNTAIYLKRTAPEVQVDYITRLGADSFSDRIRAMMAEHHIGTDRVETSATRIPGLYAITTKAGERSFTYWRDQSAAREMFQTPNGPDFSGLEGYDLIYLSAITLAILPADIRDALKAYILQSPSRLAFDSNYRPRLWPDAATARACIAQWWEIADIHLPSIDDEMDLTGEDAETVSARFLGYGKSGGLKRGPEGPLCLGGTQTRQSYPAAERVVDTTSAGDSFNGAYLGRLISGGSQEEALMAGHRCAARVVGFRGAIVPAQ